MDGSYGEGGGADIDYEGGGFAGGEAAGYKYWLSDERMGKCSRSEDAIPSKPVGRTSPALYRDFNALLTVLARVPARLSH